MTTVRKREDKVMRDFLSNLGISPDADLRQQNPKMKLNPDTLDPSIKVGAKVLEVHTGFIGEIVELDRNRGILFKALNRGPEVIIQSTSQEHFEGQLKLGYAKMIKQ